MDEKPSKATPATPASPSSSATPAAPNSDAKKQPAENPTVMTDVAQKIAASQNVLIALSSDPSVDELATAIGLSMFLDRLGKRATAIYSGTTPNILEFLKPDEIFETSADTLQDFVIALNKEKADHLRYKLDGDFVKIFITPYKTRIAESDLAYSYGDYNVDLVLALDVANGVDLDSALREHGRIMHDAVIINITTGNPGKLGEIEWSDKNASSVAEMITRLLFTVTNETLEDAEATAFLTGIVAATNRFSNAKTTPDTMEMASNLMRAGANQQLVSENITPEVDNELLNRLKQESAAAEEQKLENLATPAAVVEAPAETAGTPAESTSEASAETTETAAETSTASTEAPAEASVEAPIEATAEEAPATEASVEPAAPESKTAEATEGTANETETTQTIETSETSEPAEAPKAESAAEVEEAAETPATVPESAEPSEPAALEDPSKIEITHEASPPKISLSEADSAPKPASEPESAPKAEAPEPTTEPAPEPTPEPVPEASAETSVAPEASEPEPAPAPAPDTSEISTPAETPVVEAAEATTESPATTEPSEPAEPTITPEPEPTEPASDTSSLLDDLKAAEASLSSIGAETVAEEKPTSNSGPTPVMEISTSDDSPEISSSGLLPSEPTSTDSDSGLLESSEDSNSGEVSSGDVGFLKSGPEKTIQPPSEAEMSAIPDQGQLGEMLESALSSVGADVVTPAQTIVSPPEGAAESAPQPVAAPEPVAAPVNPATAAAPAVASNPEINGVPEINYVTPAGADLLPPPPAPPIDMTTSPMNMPPTDSPVPPAPTLPTVQPPVTAAPAVPTPAPAPDAFKIPGM